MNFDLSKLTGKLLELAKISDTKSENPNGTYLDTEQEISIFMQEVDKALKSGEVKQEDISEILGLQKSQTVKNINSIDDIESIYVNELSQQEKELVTSKTQEKTDSDFLEMSHELDGMLIENEITGLGAILNRLPEYDLSKLAERYKNLETTFNDVEKKVENWYRDPETEEIRVEEKNVFEIEAQKILGIPYEEYLEKYEAELQEVAKIPPIIRGVSSITDILLHEKAVSELSESAFEVYKAVSKLNSILATEFNAWENDIRYNAMDKTSEMSMDIVDSMYTVEMNEYTSDEYWSQEFEMPENWLVKNNFTSAIEEIYKTHESSGISSETLCDSKKSPTVRKVLLDGNFVIEKVCSDGEKKYYDISGKFIKSVKD